MLARAVIAFVAAILIASGCGSSSDGDSPQMPAGSPKAVQVEFHITKERVAARGMAVSYNEPRSYVGDPKQLRIRLKGFSGETLERLAMADPRGIRTYDLVELPEDRLPERLSEIDALEALRLLVGGGLPSRTICEHLKDIIKRRPGGPGASGLPEIPQRELSCDKLARPRPEVPRREQRKPVGHVYKFRDEASGVVAVPFHSSLESVEFSDEQGKRYGALSLRNGIREFCADAKEDSDCQTWIRNESDNP
jgi:hypothetical protein